jgi:hypothetical protein
MTKLNELLADEHTGKEESYFSNEDKCKLGLPNFP